MKVELCEKSALDALLLPVLRERQLFVGETEPCECGSKHLTAQLRIHAVKHALGNLDDARTRLRALETPTTGMSIGDALLD